MSAADRPADPAGAVPGASLPPSRSGRGPMSGLRAWPATWAANWMLAAGLGLAVLLAAAAVWVAVAPPAGAERGSLLMRLKPPGTDGAWLGTDQLGRDLWARVLAGLPWSLGIALAASLIATVLGAAVGLAAAWYPGRTRRLLSQSIDTVIAFPSLVLAVTVIALVGRGFWPLAITLGLATWPIAARVVYAEALSVIERDYVVAARLLGVGDGAILIGHVLPALRPTLMVMFAFTYADMLIAESALSFLGLGLPLTAASWGNMLSESRQYLVGAPWMMLVPAGAIVLAVVTLNLIGDGVAAAARRRARVVGG